MNLIYDGYNIRHIREAFGKRPGNYHVDPDYIREGIAQKPYFWDQYTRKWNLIRLGDLFFLNDEGVPQKTGVSHGSKNR